MFRPIPQMIGIFSKQLNLGNISVGMILLLLIGKKLGNRFFDIIAATSVLSLSLVIIYYHNTGTTFMFYAVRSFAMLSVAFIIGFIKLNVLELSVLYSMIILLERYCINGFAYIFLGRTLYVCILFVIIAVIYKNCLGKLKGNIFHMWLTFLLVYADGGVFSLVFDSRSVIVPLQSFDSPLKKVIAWGILSVIITAFNIGSVYVIKKLFGKFFREINEMGKRYAAIERYFIYISCGILAAVLLMHYVYMRTYGYDYKVSKLMTMFCSFALLIQLLFITLLYRVTYFRDNLYDKERENQSLILYSSSLEKNIDDIRSIKHDIKNIFFTMGQYVEESGSIEMKEFYQSKIYPFANDEILKNDLYEKLMAIDNEQLKAFLFYKLSQALKRKIIIDFDTDQKNNSYAIGIDFTDLVRILGILIDNAIEECVSFPDSRIIIKISQNNEIASYVIKNTVDQSKKDTGIKIGVSTKGENRGSGLAIVQNAIRKYDYVLLNSYFVDDLFVQNLNIYL